jgi:myo-inositol-1(or 4)-monophosphatase
VSADSDLLVAAAREAGALALQFHRRDPKKWAKGTSSIVSEADYAVDGLLAERLRTARPDYGWLSEESEESPGRLNRDRIFVVDPIDGTRNFLEGGREWTVALAIVEDSRPVAAALFAPALGLMLHAAAGEGAFGDRGRLRASAQDEMPRARLTGPRRYVRAVADAAGVPHAAIRLVPSLAYRLALVAIGDADVAIAGPNANDWDVAAADLLVHEAGGRLGDLGAGRIRYNTPGGRHPVLVAANAPLWPAAVALVGEIGRRLE